jgi:CcmD family protein
MLAALIQNPTPNTVSYLIIGYAIIGAVGLGYVITLLVRQNNLRRDLEMLKRLQEDEE